MRRKGVGRRGQGAVAAAVKPEGLGSTTEIGEKGESDGR